MQLIVDNKFSLGLEYTLLKFMCCYNFISFLCDHLCNKLLATILCYFQMIVTCFVLFWHK